MAVNDILEIGRQGLTANRQALQTTANNIANANTPGYSRRRAQLETVNQATTLNGLQLGGGVNVSKVIRIHDDFIQKQLVSENQAFGGAKAKSENLSRVEGVITAQGQRISDLMNKFFDDFRQLATNPETSAMRNVAQNSAQAVANGFNSMESSIDDMKRDLDLKIGNSIDGINTHIRDIAHLNEAISLAESRGDQPNELYDKRDASLRELSQKIDFQSSYNQFGQVSIVTGGTTLVQGNQGNELFVQKGAGDDKNQTPGSVDIFVGNQGQGRPITKTIKDGELAGLMFVRDQVLTSAQNHLNQVAYQFANAVNSVHKEGVGLDGNAGRALFTEMGDNPADAAYKIKLNTEIEKNHELLAAGKIAGAIGDNNAATEIANLQSLKNDPSMMAGGTEHQTFNESINALMGRVGTHAMRENDTFTHQQAVVDQLENYRQSVSGVSLEEEAVNLVQYQTAFNAAAKAMKVGDELFQTILSIKN